MEKQDKCRFNFVVDNDLRKHIKLYCVKNNITMKDLAIKAIEQYIANDKSGNA